VSAQSGSDADDQAKPPSALEELKLCSAKQEAFQSRIWPMASVLWVFSLAGIAILGRESAEDWQTVAVIGVAGLTSVGVLWTWRFIDWNETFWQDVVYARMWELESRLGFLTNLSIHFLLQSPQELNQDTYWEGLNSQDREFVERLRRRHQPRPMRMRRIFNWLATIGSLAWMGLFSIRLAEFLTEKLC